MIRTEIWWSNRGVCLFFAVGFSLFLQFGTQSHGSKPYVTRKASFYAGIEQELHSTIEWCGQFRTCLCWYLLLRDSRRGHSRPNGQFISHCLLSVKLGTIEDTFIRSFMHPSTYHPSIHPSIHTSLSMHECMHRHYVSVSLLSIMLWVAGGNCVPKVPLVNASAVTAPAEAN